MECSLKTNQENCACTYEPCSRKGKCCECISFHRANNELPGCVFAPEVERTYDRSVARLVASRKH